MLDMCDDALVSVDEAETRDQNKKGVKLLKLLAGS